MSLWKNNRGDTIVEVLIAIAVVSTILAGAFVSANRSRIATRTAQERGEALHILSGQLESLKALSTNQDNQIFIANHPPVLGPPPVAAVTNLFCIKESADGVVFLPNPPLPAITVTLDETANYTNTAAVANGGGVCTQTPQGGVKYYTAIERDLPTNTFTLHVRWDNVGGTGNDEIILVYRLYPS
ncbi:MAG: type II secretion system protein [Patescibacteria group bacterium]